MNNNVDILSSVAGAQVRAGGHHDGDLEGFIGFKFDDLELLTIFLTLSALN